MVHGALQDVGLGQKVGVEDHHQLALGRAQPVFQRARLESGAIRAVHVLDVQIGMVALQHRDRAQTDVLRLVGGIVEHLDLKTIAGIANGGHRLEQALDHVHFVEERKLHRHRGQLGVLALGLRLLIAVAVVQEHQQRAVESVDREGQQNHEVGRCQDAGDIHGV